ncbi:MAG: hypothetical protein IT379_10770 [Deltaproteobacteria bacterium]|nr:hypothetical protein [Deltaproteobacteria bacterium]
MPPSRQARIRIVCEDVEQRRFLERLCDAWGIGPRRRFVAPLPSGRGAGDAWVREQYVENVRVVRSQRHQRRLGLVAMIDGDDVGVAERKRSLDAALTASGAEARDAGEPIAVAVPTWSVETWLWWLCGEDGVDETTPYKRDADYQRAVRAGDVTPEKAAKAWLAGPRAGEAERVSSLSDARLELERLP